MASASSVSVLDLDEVCSQEVGPWPRIFLSLASKVVSSTPSLLKKRFFLKNYKSSLATERLVPYASGPDPPLPLAVGGSALKSVCDTFELH